MNDLPRSNIPAEALQRFQYPNFDICWAGANPIAPGFCFGSEDGTLLFTDEQGIALAEPGKASISEEAINGVVASQGWLGVTTRADINFIGPPSVKGGPRTSVIFNGGAHGITVAPSGHFVVPMGPSGVLFVKPGSRPEDPTTVLRADRENLSFYRVICLPGDRGQDVVVCAGRRGGVGVTDFRIDTSKRTLNTVSFEDLDIVDVCSIGTAAVPLAVAALGRNGSVILFKDMLRDKAPKTLKFNSVKGTAYRLLSSRGELFVLTSKGLYVLSKLAGRFVEGTPLGTIVTQVMTISVEASDANLVAQRWLLAVCAGHVLKIDTHLIEEPATIESNGSIENADAQPTVFAPHWEEQTMTQLATL